MMRSTVLCLILLAAVPRAHAQGLPPYRALNPLVAARSIVGFVPLRDTAAGWRRAVALDYGNMVEVDERGMVSLAVDAEVMRLTLSASRNLGSRGFLRATATWIGAYGGFLDKPVSAFHDLFGFPDGQRPAREDNTFEYRVALPGENVVERESSAGFFGDVAVTGGLLLTPHVQLAATVALPTRLGPEGYTVETLATALNATARSDPLGGRLTLEGSVAIGYTPRQGALADWQRTTFTAATAGGRFRFLGRQSAYVNFFQHSPVYRNTTLPAMDREELTLDMGFLFLLPGGQEIRAGMTEDLLPSGPAVDLVFRIGVRW